MSDLSAPLRPTDAGTDSALAVVIMAAGKGTRMNDPERAKVMFPIGGRPMVAHVVDCAFRCGAGPVILIIGYKGESVREYFADVAPDAPLQFAEQREQLGTAHAVMQAGPFLQDFRGDVLVLSGDVPLLSSRTLESLVELHRADGAAGTVLTVTAPDPAGYGRVIRDENGAVARIVEHKDATEQERLVDEINAGIYVFNAPALFDALPRVGNANVQGEYYLPDVLSIFLADGLGVSAYRSENFGEIQGINTVEQLRAAEESLSVERSDR